MNKKKFRKLIDYKESKLEDDLINNYMIIVSDFIKNRKRKITL